MTKLNQRKIIWIIREIENGRSMSEISRIQGVTRVRIWQLYHEYLSTGEIPELKKPGRKRKEISEEEKEIQKSFETTYLIFGKLQSEGAKYCSMGMSGDFELAIKCGSNMLRLGSILFNPDYTIDIEI